MAYDLIYQVSRYCMPSFIIIVKQEKYIELNHLPHTKCKMSHQQTKEKLVSKDDATMVVMSSITCHFTHLYHSELDSFQTLVPGPVVELHGCRRETARDVTGSLLRIIL